MKNYVLTSESVTEGHPDKICDQISDAILDDLLSQDPNSRVAVETLVTTGSVHVAGEVTTKGFSDVQRIVRQTLRDIGYTDPKFGIDADDAGVWISIHGQSPDISQGVSEINNKEQGAGDQGMMYGFACTETPQLMPLPIVLAHKLTKKLSEVRKTNAILNLGPDGKSQVSIEYENDVPKRIDAIVIAQQHKEEVSEEVLRKEIIEKVILPVCADLIDQDTKIHVNATGRFVIGGPEGDTGVTGRKIIVDTYGGIGRHGGGAFCLGANSMVNTEKGLVRIDECSEIGKKGLLVKTDIHPMPCGDWYDNGLKETEIIETSDGYSLEATPNHNIRIIDKEGNYVWKTIKELQTEEWIPIQTKNRFFGNDKILEFKYSYKAGTTEGRKKRYNFPSTLTKDYCFLLGLLIGDGDCTDEGNIKLCICENEMKDIVQNLYNKLFNDDGKVFGHWAYIGGVEMRAYLKHLGLGYAKSFEKVVPKAIFNAGKENCAAFLRGLFDTDGSIRMDGRNKNTKRIHLATTSKILAEQTQLLLLNFGIVSTIQKVEVGKKDVYIKGRKINSKHPRYDLTIKGSKGVQIFSEDIGFTLSRKQKLLQTDVPTKKDFRIIPNQRNRIIELFKKLPFNEQKLDTCKIARFTRNSKEKATKELTYEKLKQFTETYQQFLRNEKEFVQLQELFFMGHYYSKLQNKIPSFAHTYDLNVPFSHTFTANGFVCHNSGKDPSKVDRSGAYMARYIAKNIVAADLADKCEIQLSYAIGVAKPTSVNVNCFGTNKIPEEKIALLVYKNFDMTPKGMIETLRLKRPIFRKTATYGHFGRDEAEFTWERTDKAATLKTEAF